MYTYIYIYVCMCMYICIYIYISISHVLIQFIKKSRFYFTALHIIFSNDLFSYYYTSCTPGTLYVRNELQRLLNQSCSSCPVHCSSYPLRSCTSFSFISIFCITGFSPSTTALSCSLDCCKTIERKINLQKDDEYRTSLCIQFKEKTIYT